jgi:hypothetical protein
MQDETSRDEEVDPEDFLRALLKISPEDAAKVREDAAKRHATDDDEQPSGQHEPTGADRDD